MRIYIYYSFITITIIFILIPFVFLETYELGFSIKKVFDNIMVFGFLSFILSLFFHGTIFRPTETKNKIFYIITKVFKIIFGSFFSFIFICGIISGLLLSINSYIGKQELINLKSKVISTNETVSKNGLKHYYITVEIPNEKRNVELKVKSPYMKGETFEGQLYKGSLNMYYK